MYQDSDFRVDLLDDGTLDTVVEVTDLSGGDVKEYRYCLETAADYRDETGCLNLATFAEDVVIPNAHCDVW